MTIDRTALRQLWLAGSWKVSGHAGTILDAVPQLLDELDAKDRRIAELEGQVKMMHLAPVPAAAPNVQRAWEAYDTMRDGLNAANRTIADLELRLSIATELNVNDRKRIAELETGLREALDWWAPGSHEFKSTLDEYDRLRKLLPSEET